MPIPLANYTEAVAVRLSPAQPSWERPGKDARISAACQASEGSRAIVFVGLSTLHSTRPVTELFAARWAILHVTGTLLPAGPNLRPSVRPALWILLSIAIAAESLAFALQKVDLRKIGYAFAHANYLYLFPCVVLLTAYFLITAINWTFLLQLVGHFTLRKVIPVTMIGFGGNNLFPMRLGEAARTCVFAHQYGKPVGVARASLVLERIPDVLYILVICVLTLFALCDVSSAVATGVMLVALALLLICFGIAAFLFIPTPFLKPWHVFSAWLPRTWRERGTHLIKGTLHCPRARNSPESTPRAGWSTALTSSHISSSGILSAATSTTTL